MTNENDQLNREQIQLLPIKTYRDSDVGTIENGIFYSKDGEAIGKIASFEFSQERTYPLRIILPSSGPVLMSWKDLRSKEFLDNEWRVHSLVPKYGLTILAGVSGEKKTWMALYMACCIANGSHLFGQAQFPTTKGKILYIDAEMGPRELQRRGKLLGFDAIEDDQILLMSGDLVSFREDEDFESLDEIVTQNNIDVLIIDTLRAVAGGMNEDKAEEVRGFLQRFNIFKNKGITIIILDHFRKPARNEGSSPKKEHLLGSQDKVASSESIIALRSEMNSPAFAIYQLKSRNGVGVKPFLALMKDVLGESRIEFLYEGEHDEQTTKMDTAKIQIPMLIGTGSMTTRQIEEVMQKVHQVGRRYVQEALRHLTKEEKLIVAKLGRQNSYSNPTLTLLPIEDSSSDELGILGN